MATSEKRKLIRSKIEAGASPQQVYDELHGPGNAADEQLADLVRYVPTLERRAEYRTAQLVLLALLAVVVAWKIGIELPAAARGRMVDMVYNSVWCVGYAVGFLGVFKYWRRAHTMVGVLAFLDLMQLRPNGGLAVGGMVLAGVVLLGAVAVLGIYLQRKLTPAYITLKEPYVNADGQKRLKQVVRFGD